jgi:ornithine cyclodeaminase
MIAATAIPTEASSLPTRADGAAAGGCGPSTLFLGVEEVAAIVRSKGLAGCIAGVARHIEADFRRWHAFDKSARVACHSPLGVIELMPIACERRYSFKYVNGHPSNPGRGLPTVMAFGVLADVATGAPLLLSELTITTAIRTAAMSALAARHLARRDSRVMALVGNGAQGEFQALAFRDLVGIGELRLYDTDPAATARLAANLAGSGLRLHACTSAAQAVHGADIVTTATADKSLARVLGPGMVAPGVHVNAVGGDCPGKTELHPAILEAASVFCEYEPQTRLEGELQQMPPGFPATEFWEVLLGRRPGRTHPAQITVFDSVGFALEDYSALRFLHAAADELGIGRPIRLVPAGADPKDLFGTLRGLAGGVALAAPAEAPGWPVAT